MKKIKLLLALALFSVTVSAQKNWSVELGVGNHSIADECADLTDNLYHLDGVVRYSFNEKFGAGLYTGFDKLSLEDYISKVDAQTTYFRASLEGVADVLEITDLSNDKFTILAHGGFGASYFKVDNGYSNLVPNVSGGLTGLFKLTKSVALKADWSTTAHFNQGRTLNGTHGVTNVGINSFINNATVGVVVYFGKGKKSEEHYDWYEEPKVDELAAVRKKIQDLHRAFLAKQQIEIDVTGCCNDDFVGEIYFEEGSSKIGIYALDRLQEVKRHLNENPEAVLDLVGFACTTHGSDAHNLQLSKDRANNVYDKLISMGIHKSRLKAWGEGKDKRFVGKYNSDLAKRVELRIK